MLRPLIWGLHASQGNQMHPIFSWKKFLTGLLTFENTSSLSKGLPESRSNWKIILWQTTWFWADGNYFQPRPACPSDKMFHIPNLTAAGSREQGSQVSAIIDHIHEGCDIGWLLWASVIVGASGIAGRSWAKCLWHLCPCAIGQRVCLSSQTDVGLASGNHFLFWVFSLG